MYLKNIFTETRLKNNSNNICIVIIIYTQQFTQFMSQSDLPNKLILSDIKTHLSSFNLFNLT